MTFPTRIGQPARNSVLVMDNAWIQIAQCSIHSVTDAKKNAEVSIMSSCNPQKHFGSSRLVIGALYEDQHQICDGECIPATMPCNGQCHPVINRLNVNETFELIGPMRCTEQHSNRYYYGPRQFTASKLAEWLSSNPEICLHESSPCNNTCSHPSMPVLFKTSRSFRGQDEWRVSVIFCKTNIEGC